MAAYLMKKIARMVGVFLLASFMTVVFLLSGLLLNSMQAILYVTLYNRNRGLYRKLNYYLITSTWLQTLVIGEWWSGSAVNMYGNEESLAKFGKEHCIIVMNHKYDTDWLVCWHICDKLGMLGNAKSCAKKPLRNVPVIGWGWIFAEMIFLERNWEKDKLTMGAKLDKLAAYEDPIMILYFCEGTRFTPEKHKASMEFAKARNIPQLQHHLIPRTTGFNFTAKHLKEKIPAIYDVQLGYPETDVKPTFSNMLRGHRFVADVHIRRISMSEVPTDSDENTSKWLHQLYQDKDHLMDNYFKTQKFPGRCIHLKPGYRSLLNSVFWAITVGLPFFYLLFQVFTSGNVFLTSTAVSLFAVLFTVMYFMVRATKADKGSSYGTDKKTPEKSTNGSKLHTNGSYDKDKAQESSKQEINENVIKLQHSEQSSL